MSDELYSVESASAHVELARFVLPEMKKKYGEQHPAVIYVEILSDDLEKCHTALEQALAELGDQAIEDDSVDLGRPLTQMENLWLEEKRKRLGFEREILRYKTSFDWEGMRSWAEAARNRLSDYDAQDDDGFAYPAMKMANKILQGLLSLEVGDHER